MDSRSLDSADLSEDNHVGSASETNSDEDVSEEYYQQIPMSDADDEEEDENPERFVDSRESHRSLPNGYHTHRGAETGISALELNGDAEQKSENEDEDEEEVRVDASELAIARAFREDERRRNAPLTQENAARVVEAMRRVSFHGSAPDWTADVPENRWIDHLRRLRQPFGASSAVQN